MLRKWSLFIFISLCCCSFSFAAPVEVTGRVLDTSGALVPGADVTVTDAAGKVYHMTSDASGRPCPSAGGR